MSRNRRKTDGETKQSKRTNFFQQNVFDLNQKDLQVFQAFCLLKSTEETSGDTQKA